MRVLVVDDSRTMRAILRRALGSLKRPDTEVIEAADGAEALQILRNERLEIDLVLLDWNMPRLDGIGFLKAVKVLAPFKEVAVIMVTSQSQRGHVAEALRWGARDYIVKPFTEDVVLEKLNRLQTQIDARKCAETSHLLEAIAKSASADGKAPFLSELSPELAEELKARGVRAGFEPDVVLALPAQVFETLDVVLSGEVRVETASGGEERLGIGDCLGDESFVSGAVFGGTARASGRVELLRVSRAAVGDLVRRFPKLSVALSGRLARRSTSRRKAEEGVGFSGRLAAMPISDLVQVLHLCRKTGELRLQRDGREASVFIEDGSVRDAKSGAHQGEAAVYEILGWRDAEFTFRSGAKSGRTTIEQPTLTLLLEGARRLDEASNA